MVVVMKAATKRKSGGIIRRMRERSLEKKGPPRRPIERSEGRLAAQSPRITRPKRQNAGKRAGGSTPKFIPLGRNLRRKLFRDGKKLLKEITATHFRHLDFSKLVSTYVDPVGKKSCKICRRAAARLNRNRTPTRPAYRHSEQCHLTKLRVEQVRQIRLLLADGSTDASVSRQFSVNPSTIKAIRAGRSWRHAM